MSSLVSLWSVDVWFTKMMNITELYAVDIFLWQVQLVEKVLVQHSSGDLSVYNVGCRCSGEYHV